MKRMFPAVLVPILALCTFPANARQIHESDPAACAPGAGRDAVLVRAQGFRDRVGRLRVAIYRAVEDEFLASGKYVTRIDTPMTAEGDMLVCAPVPGPGTYVISILHDRNENGRMDPFSDGVGFAGNPRLALAKPPLASVTRKVAGTTHERIVLNYLRGLSVRPLKGVSREP